MTTAQLAQRMGVAQPSVVALEQSESLGRIRLDTLQRAASALNCRVVYALVPDQPLEVFVEAQKRERAERQLAAIEHSMSLEDQSVTDKEVRERHLQEISERIVEKSLWDTQK